MSSNDNISFGPGGKGKLSEDKLMAYLEGKLSPAEQHEVEQWLAEEGMESDAMEGLQAQHISDTRHSVDKLNHKLRTAILSKKRRRKPLNTNYLSWVAIAIVLLLAIVAYIVVRKSM
jgi:anti-sigma factor RsiW